MKQFETGPGIYINSGAPRIVGTRVTVWDVLALVKEEMSTKQIADWYGVTVEQVEDALSYIDRHREDVEEVWRYIEERNARGNPPEVEERLKKSEGAARRLREKLRQEKEGGQPAGSWNSGGR